MSNSRTEVRSPTRTEVRSPTRTSTRANTRGNFTSTVTGGAGAGRTSVTINIPRQTPHDTGFICPIVMSHDTGSLLSDPASIPGAIIAKAKANPPLAGAVLGAAIGHFAFKKPIIGALVGWTIGFAGSFTQQAQ